MLVQRLKTQLLRPPVAVGPAASSVRHRTLASTLFRRLRLSLYVHGHLPHVLGCIRRTKKPFASLRLPELNQEIYLHHSPALREDTRRSFRALPRAGGLKLRLWNILVIELQRRRMLAIAMPRLSPG